MLIKHKIKKFNLNDDKSVIIPIFGNNNESGQYQAIADFIESQADKSINPVADGEKFRFKPRFEKQYVFKFSNGITLDDSLLFAGFTESEISSGEDVVQNSFYICQFFDTNDINNQTRLHTSYLNGFTFYVNANESTTYSEVFLRDIEFLDIYLSENFLSSKDNIFNIYARFYFYNAKTGEAIPFFNADITDTSDIKNRVFWRAEIRKSDRDYNFIVNSNTLNLNEVTNMQYRNKLQESISSLRREKPTPPSGKGFSSNGTYIEI